MLPEEYPVLDGNSDQGDILGALAEADQHVGAIQFTALQKTIPTIESSWIGTAAKNVLIEGVEKYLVGRVGAIKRDKFRTNDKGGREAM